VSVGFETTGGFALLTIAYPENVILDGHEEELVLPRRDILLDALEQRLAVVQGYHVK
jgi:hypothetical protein